MLINFPTSPKNSPASQDCQASEFFWPMAQNKYEYPYDFSSYKNASVIRKKTANAAANNNIKAPLALATQIKDGKDYGCQGELDKGRCGKVALLVKRVNWLCLPDEWADVAGFRWTDVQAEISHIGLYLILYHSTTTFDTSVMTE